jgi:dipeptidyl aminopeptidase/acylaminoacyl peptidase
MSRTFLSAALVILASQMVARTQVSPPDSLVLDGIPPIPVALKESAGPYLESRTAALQDWHPERKEILITTRFADSAQLHEVRMPGGARRQLTFFPEPVSSASYRPKTADFVLFAQDFGGGEFYQVFRRDFDSGRTTLLTDGKSRNEGGRWARSGKWLGYTSTRRNGKDNDIYVMNPAEPKSDRLLLEVNGGGWSVGDWSHDESQLLVAEYISITRSRLHLVDIKTGARRQITPDSTQEVAYASPRFAVDDKSLLVLSDQDSEFRRLLEFAVPAAGSSIQSPKRVLTGKLAWDVDDFELSEDGKTIAFISNEDGVGVLHLLNAKTGAEIRAPKLPKGIVSNLRWHENNRDLAFNITSARSPLDVYSLDLPKGTVDRWTESETGGLDASRFVEPELIRLKSFDGLVISAFLYRPDPQKFPGKRPSIISIHGGPESQARPGFLARNNYFLNELGIALVVPNVRGSSGYGKKFLSLDNGFKREDSVKDIGALIELLRNDANLDPDRIAVMGGSYGGYMVLACMEHFNDRLRCGIDIVGISNFLTFLKNTQDYRRDLRRVEYGDERDPAMAEFLGRISPTTNVQKIKKPLLVVQGKNDPRVPVTEAEQMVKAIREGGGAVWYLMAKDEGHGFAKKKNADFQFLTTIAFLQEFLLK